MDHGLGARNQTLFEVGQMLPRQAHGRHNAMRLQQLYEGAMIVVPAVHAALHAAYCSGFLLIK
jgi:hypothetical protein